MVDQKNKIAQRIYSGDRLAIARTITSIENEEDGYVQLLDAVHKKLNKAYRIGITGPPGAGKSTLTNHLVKILRKQNKKVAIIAVDPTSPFSGGAILGDRIRMTEISTDKGVFIRSMATRGTLGGLARQATEVADIFDAAGYDFIIFETVGVGQIELDIADTADTTVVMVVPEGGDIIQGMKAGLMEIGDLFLVNKSDRPGAERMQKDLEYVLHLKELTIKWSPKVLLTVAHQGKGIQQVWDEIGLHQEFLINNKLLKKKRAQRLKHRVEVVVQQKIDNFFWNNKRKEKLLNYLKNDKDTVSPYKIANQLFKDLTGNIK